MSMNVTSESLYFIAISPINPLQERISAIKNDIHQKYGIKGAFRSPAHITLQMPFKKKINKIANLQVEMSAFAKTQDPFKIDLNGFGVFEPRVVYIKVMENQKLQLLHKKFHRLLKLHQIFGSTYRQQAFHPHITIAFRDLKKQQFYPLWEEYQHKDFQEHFQANGLTLYKHNGEVWEEHQHFPFSTI
jgi:2'-5' RNA ligase